jgi:hypothetical protein
MRLDLQEAIKTLQESQGDLSSPEKDINNETFDVRVAELIGGDIRNLDITRISASLFKNGALVAEKGLKITEGNMEFLLNFQNLMHMLHLKEEN